MNNTDNRCRNCKFFDRHGKCRRYPPTVFMVRNTQAVKFLRHLPDVTPDEYCGEFESKFDGVPTAVTAGQL